MRESIRIKGIVSVALCLALVVAGTGCPRDGEEGDGTQQEQVQQLQLDLDQDLVITTSVLAVRLRGTERQVAQKVVFELDGTLDDGAPFTWRYEGSEAPPMAVERPADEAITRSGVYRSGGDTGDLVVAIAVEDALWAEVAPDPTRTFQGEVRVSVIDLFGKKSAEGVVMGKSLRFTREIAPRVDAISGGQVYPDERVIVGGEGFLRPEEGETLMRIEQGMFSPEDGSTPRSLDGAEVAFEWDGARDRARLVIDPVIFGVKVGTFEGDIRFVNRLRDGSLIEGNTQQQVSVSLQQPFISTLACGAQDPCLGGARGQRIVVKGRGLAAPGEGVVTTLSFEGVFTPDDPELEAVELSGPSRLERAPDRFIDDQAVEISVWYEIVRQGRKASLTGLGAVPGTFRGKITPLLTSPHGSQSGLPWSGEFRVLPSRQVVYLKYLPRFSTGLDKYGLRNVENELRARILQAAQLPYEDFNVLFVDAPPQDFIDYATIELSGPDPFGDGTFGYDNSTNDGIVKDTGNLFLADYIGGYNQGSADEFDNPFGGIYIESFDYFSPTISARKNGQAVADANASFDEILSPFMPELGGTPVRATEVADGPRVAQIQEAIDMVANVIGNTVAHEVGHSMGMTYVRADDVSPTMTFHNSGDSPGALMDSGSNRSFEERAAINGVAPATFNELNTEYLNRILPK